MSREQRRGQLIEAAVRLIGSRGIQGTTMSRISAELGLSEMAAYRHFASKDEILMEAVSYLLGQDPRLAGLLAESLHHPSPSEIGERHLDMLASDLDLYTAPYCSS